MAGWVEGARASAGFVPDIPPLPPAGAPPGPPTVPPALPAPGTPQDEPEIELPGLEAAIRKLLNRQLLSAADYYALDAAAKQEAFTISGEVTEATLAQIRELLAENLEGPANREAFSRAVREAFDSLPISDSHLEHVYRNAANQAYTQGMDHVLDHPLVVDSMPYRAYFAIHDSPRVRSNHLAMETLGLDGTNVYYKDDPTWLRFKPPWDWNCRCGWAPLSIRDAARLGVREAQEWLETGIEPAHLFVQPPPFAPSPSWDLVGV